MSRTPARISSIRFRTPDVLDGDAMWRLARASGTLDLNPPYTYLMACRHFGDTSVIADDGDDPAGYCLAYRLPSSPETVFVWQITVDPSRRTNGIAGRMLDAVVELDACRGVRYLDANVTPSNTASKRLFQSFAERRAAPIEESPCFDTGMFPDEAPHDPEHLLRIGPFT